jgi:hypothetical protein
MSCRLPVALAVPDDRWALELLSEHYRQRPGTPLGTLLQRRPVRRLGQHKHARLTPAGYRRRPGRGHLLEHPVPPKAVWSLLCGRP